MIICYEVWKNIERTNCAAYILCKKDNGYILKNVIIDKLQESFNMILDPIKIDNHQLSIDNILKTKNIF